ncbi:hypothetical protein BCR34DRAFT_571078 [Clohesyomyces aquaticus]|uniref:Uncharacterized protein n=1 Tax=Clohesyomyces aquaticus TaxID=1231657 RepID=A0A1Y1Z8Z2_9PLEO|nr:hypothetical protein BCR34DRAFT_571078 [Clohesyomyces aquaticus]
MACSMASTIAMATCELADAHEDCIFLRVGVTSFQTDDSGHFKNFHFPTQMATWSSPPIFVALFLFIRLHFTSLSRWVTQIWYAWCVPLWHFTVFICSVCIQ